MSLIVDPDWTIQQLRLTYLRNVDDHYGPRIISFANARTGVAAGTTKTQNAHDAASTSIYAALDDQAEDSHIAMAALDDPTEHPELTTVYSPSLVPLRGMHTSDSFTLSPPSAASSSRQSTRPSVTRQPSLRYTQTIYGPGRSGALGMRVTGKRSSLTKPSPSSKRINRPPAKDDANTSHPPPPRRSSSDDAPATTPHSPVTERHSLDAPSIPRLSIRRPTDHGPGSWSLDEQQPPSDAFPLPTPSASSEADTDTTTDTADCSPAMLPVPLPTHRASLSRTSSTSRSQRRIIADDPHARKRSASTSATDVSRPISTSGASSVGDEDEDADDDEDGMQETLEHSDGSIAPMSSTKWYGSTATNTALGLKHLRSDSSLSSLASHPADDTSTPYPPQSAAFVADPHAYGSRSTEGTPRFSRHAFQSAVPTQPLEQQESATSRQLPLLVEPQDDDDDATRRLEQPLRQAKPSSEALLAARSRLRRPSRSHLRGKTLAQRNAERQQQQNAWFQSHAIGNAQVAQVHAKPKVSALSAMLQKQSAQPENPFAHFYAGIAGRNAGSGAGTMSIDVYFPWATDSSSTSSKTARSPSGAVSTNAAGKILKLVVRKDATMEELIGYGLFCFVEEGWAPDLELGGPPEVRLTTLGWVLRIVEDGEIDDDYPAIDRSLVVGKFGQDEFAIVDASPQQIKQNEDAQTSVKRRNSRLTAPLPTIVTSPQTPTSPGPTATAAGAGTGAPSGAAVAASNRLGVNNARAGGGGAGPGALGTNAPAGSLISVAGTPIIASSAIGKASAGISSGIFLRVAVTPNAQVRYKTTLNVPSETYLADVLDLICKKRRLENPDEWAFVVPDENIVVPLDRTVESLQGSHDLALVKRSTLGAQGGQAVLASQSTNPNASIFKRLSEPAQPRYNAAKDITSSYKSWTVNRKMPMFVGRHERTLTIDGDWIHIIPTDTRAFYAHAASFPILDVISCKQSTKLPQNFKLIFSRDNDKKRYDLEAEDSKQAAEIAFEVTTRKRAMRR